MNTLKKLPWLFALCLTLAAQSHAAVYIGFGNREPHRRWRHHRQNTQAVIVTPAPYYAAYPYPYPVYVAPAPAGPVVPGLTGDYAADLANLNEKVVRMRRVVQRQHEKDLISQVQYDRFMNVLDSIERDERARAFDHDGNLTRQDFADFYHRIDQASEDIELALAE